jgi:urease subunit beta
MSSGLVPGQLFPADGEIETLPGVPRTEVEVTNTGDREVHAARKDRFFAS